MKGTNDRTMMITSIREYDKKKVLVQLDGHLIFPLYKGEVQKYHLAEGEELSQRVYTELVEEVLSKRVKLRAMNLLQKHSYTREGLRRKLLEGKYPDFLIEEALDYVTKYRYLDDDRYAQEYIRCYSENRSKRRIMQDLSAKGVCQEIIERAWEDYEAINAPVDEKAQVLELLRKKSFDASTADRKEAARMMSFLYRKGYGMDIINQCIHMREDYEE